MVYSQSLDPVDEEDAPAANENNTHIFHRAMAELSSVSLYSLAEYCYGPFMRRAGTLRPDYIPIFAITIPLVYLLSCVVA